MKKCHAEKSKQLPKLLEVSNNTAMLTTFNEVEYTATNVMVIAKRKKEQFMKDHDGTKLGFMSFFMQSFCSSFEKVSRS